MPEYPYRTDDATWECQYVFDPVRRILARHAPPPRRVFDLGCGNGTTARRLATDGYSVVAVDPSSSVVAAASAHQSSSLQFHVASTVDDLAATCAQFPVVISLEVIEHIPSAREFMRAFRSVLAPGGIGILSTPYHGYLKNLVLVAGGRFDRNFDPLWEGRHLKFFSIAKLRELFLESGFTRFEFQRVGRVPPLAKSVIAVLHG